ncbi:MAG: ABC transporter permease [Mycobacteriales bacterium]
MSINLGSAPREAVIVAPRRGGRGPLGLARRIAAPIGQARGMPKALFWTGVTIVAVFIVMAVFAPLVSRYGFNQYKSGSTAFPKLAHPSGAHWFGTNVTENDLFSRVVYGARTELEVVVLSLALSVVVGVLLGLVSGWLGGIADRVLVLIMDTLFAFPYLLLAIVIAFLLQSSPLGGGIVTAAVAITVIYIPQYFRVVRNSVLAVKQETYVDAARAIGAGPVTIVMRYIFSNVIQTVPVIATLNAADAILTLAGLGFLGFGVQPTVAAEWGYEVSRAVNEVGNGVWWTAVFPGGAIVLLVIGLTLVGEGLNDVVNPVLRRRPTAPVTLPEPGPQAGS